MKNKGKPFWVRCKYDNDSKKLVESDTIFKLFQAGIDSGLEVSFQEGDYVIYPILSLHEYLKLGRTMNT